MLIKKRALLLALGLQTAFLEAATETWNVNANGNWNTAANWTPAVVPNAVGEVVVFGNVITAGRTVTLDISPTVGIMNFDNANSYQISPMAPNFLTLSNAGGAAINVTNANGNGAHTISSPITLASNLAISQGSTGIFTLSGVISGAFSLTQAGPGTGTVLLSAANTYSAGTTVSSGVLQAGVVNALPVNGNLTVTAPGSVNLNGFNQSIGALAGTGNIALGAAMLTTTTGTSTAYSGSLSGTGSFIVAGPGTLTVSGANNYTGGTTVNGGVLLAAAANTLPAGGNMTVSSPGSLNLNNFDQTVGQLLGNGQVLLGSATLTLSSTTNSAFSGVISGSGSLIKTNTSTETLSGQNTYTGGTTINNGILQMGAATSLPINGNVTITAPGALDLNNFDQLIGALSGTGNITLGTAELATTTAANTAYSGVISGVGGSFLVAGPGTLTISGANNYTGGTTVIGGTLQAGAANTLPANGPVEVDNPGILNLNNFNQLVGPLSGNGLIVLGTAQLTTDTASNTTFAGPIVGAGGSLVKQGPGALVLLGPNSYSGGTTVSAGTLQGNTVSLQGNIVNDATLVFDQPFDGVYNGMISGGGTLIKDGGGILDLTGANTQAGNALVNGGTLAVNGTLSAGAVLVAPGGTLSGNGTISSVNVSVAGAVAPGGNTGVLTIMGNFTQQTGSSFITDLTPTTSDRLDVSEIVTIQPGSTFIVHLNPGSYAASTTYTVINGLGGVMGTYGAAHVTNPFFNAQLIYFPTQVQLSLTLGPFSNVIQGGNAGSVAKCFNPDTFDSSPDFTEIVQALLFLPLDEVRKDLNKMQPSSLKGLVLAEENSCLLLKSAIVERLDDLFRTDCNLQSARENSWSFWSSVNGGLMQQRNHNESPGFRAKTGIAAVGLDARFAPDAIFGAAGAYSTTKVDFHLGRGEGAIDSFYAGPYFNWSGKGAYMNLAGFATWNVYHASRHIDLSFLTRHARSARHGFGFLAHGDLGLILHPAENVTLQPLGGFDYVFLHENGFSETGAKSLDLHVSSAHNDLLRFEAGVQIAKCSNREYVKWVHHLKGSFVYEHRIFGKHYEAGFKGQSCTFTVSGLHPQRAVFDLATGLSALFSEDRGIISLIYEGMFGDRISVQSGTLQGTYRF